MQILKTAGLLLTGVALGGVITYNSNKVEIIDGVGQIKSIAIEAKEELNGVKSQKELLEKKIEQLQATITEKESEMETLQEKLNSLGQNNEDLESKIATLEKEIQSAYAEINDLNGLVEHWKKEYRNMHDMWSEYYVALVQANQKIAELEKQLESTTDATDANEQIGKANQEQEDILNFVNETIEELQGTENK